MISERFLHYWNVSHWSHHLHHLLEIRGKVRGKEKRFDISCLRPVDHYPSDVAACGVVFEINKRMRVREPHSYIFMKVKSSLGAQNPILDEGSKKEEREKKENHPAFGIFVFLLFLSVVPCIHLALGVALRNFPEFLLMIMRVSNQGLVKVESFREGGEF